MVTNGDDILFVKVMQPSYAVSRVFAPFTSKRELTIALQILKRFGQVAGEIKN